MVESPRLSGARSKPMTRRKGETTGRMNERNYPNIVELPLPFGGLRETSFAIDAFHRDAFHESGGSQASMVEATMTKDNGTCAIALPIRPLLTHSGICSAASV